MRLTCLCLIGLLLAAGLRAEVPPLLEAALRKLQADENRWAFTQTTQEFDRKGQPEGGLTVERFDPSQPYDQQWTLVRYQGREPTEREERSWRKRKDKETKRREEKSLGEVMDLENARPRSGVTKSMRNRIVRTGSKHLDQASLDARLKAAGWEGLKPKEIAFFYG